MSLTFRGYQIGEIINNSSLDKVGLVVPTLGTRIEYLVECLRSINSAGCRNIYIVGPGEKLKNLTQISGLYSKLIEDPKLGLPEAINAGVNEFPIDVEYVGWLGDDDSISAESLRNSLDILKNKNNVVATYGGCQYLDGKGNIIFINKSGKWASAFMNVLPNLIPQPGSIFRRSAYDQVGGVKSTYPLSFDFELFFKLRKLGKLQYIPEIQSSFRWHSESLSVGQRRMAVRQTSEIRKSFLPIIVRPFSFLWEPIIIAGTLLIGKLLAKKIELIK